MMSSSSNPNHEIQKPCIELTASEFNDTEKCQSTIANLKPADRGPAAWRILIAAVILESLLWGFPLSFGVFQNYYAGLPQFEDNPNIAVVGTVATGIAYLGAPAVILIMEWFPGWERVLVWVGCMLSSLAHQVGLLTSHFDRAFMFGRPRGRLFCNDFDRSDPYPGRNIRYRIRPALLPDHPFCQRVLDQATRLCLWNNVRLFSSCWSCLSIHP